MAKLPPPDPRFLKTLPVLQDAVQLYQQGRTEEAQGQFLQVLKKAPDQPDALYFLGRIKLDQGKPADAIKLLTKAVRGNPRFAEAHFFSGSALNMLGRPLEALAAYNRAIAIRSHDVNALNHLGNTLRRLNRPQEALAAYDKALAVAMDFAEAHNNRGVVLAELKRFPEAIVSYEHAIASKQDFAEAYSNRGAALLILSRPDEALADFDRALALDPNYAEAINNRGSALQDLNRHREAQTWHQRALALNPNNAIAHLNLSTAHLCLGDYAEGWREYEWRWETPDLAPIRRDRRRPRWQGDQSLAGKTILLHAEQGYGDTIQFARYVSKVADRDARILLEVPHALRSLFAGLPGVATLIPRGDKLPAFDVHAPLLSLPLAFRTDAATIPADVPYMGAPPDRVAKWKGRLAERSGRKIGLAWSGRSYPRNRSIPFATLEPLLSLPDTVFVSLQQEAPQEDLARIANRPNLLHFGGEIEDFADTAGIIASLDLVISVDTAVAHLAGAMAKPLWVLLLYGADFRWLLDRDDSPWYPTARLFRQRRIGDWSDVVARVRAALDESLCMPGT